MQPSGGVRSHGSTRMLIAVLMGAGCGAGPAPAEDALPSATAEVAIRPPISEVEIISGNGQSAIAGGELPEPVIVRVIDVTGAPVSFHPMRYEAVVGDGSSVVGEAVTDVAGMARARWTLGPMVGHHLLHIAATDFAGASFDAMAR
jgi:hypothetical protein